MDIAAGDTTVERVRLELAPGERRRHQLPNVFAADTRLRARLLTAAGAPAGDDLALDDTAYAVVPPSPAAACCAWGARTSTSTARC